MNEFVVTRKKGNSNLIIGKFKKSDISSGIASGKLPRIAARFFPYKSDYEKTPFLKSLTLLTKSRIKNSKFLIRLYTINEKGEPGDFIFNKKIIGSAKKGRHLTEIDLSNYNILFAKDGLFVAIEWLMIEENKYEYIYTKDGSRKKLHGLLYQPSFGTILSDSNEYSWFYIFGRWQKTRLSEFSNRKDFGKFNLLAIELILSE